VKLQIPYRFATFLCATLVLTQVPAWGVAAPERKLLSGVERARDRRDLPPVTIHQKLSRRAERHAAEMASAGELFHSDLQRTCRGLEYSACGEVVGVGPRASSLIRAFMLSRPHRRILLGSAFDRVGIGAVREDGLLWVSMVFFGK